MKTLIKLIGFEYKKIFMRTASVVVLSFFCLGVFLIAINPPMPGIVSDVDLHQAKDVFAKLDSELLQKTIDKYKELEKVPSGVEETPYGKEFNPKAFEKTLLPYEEIFNLINVIYEADFDNLGIVSSQVRNVAKQLPIEKIETINDKDFYKQYLTQKQNLFLTQKSRGLNPIVPDNVQPLNFGYAKGYTSFINTFDSQGMIIALLLLTLGVCCAPIFAAEHQQNTHCVIISTKHGRSKVAWAKIFTGFSFAFILSIIFYGVILLSRLIFFGFEGADVSIQFFDIFSPYTITFGKVCAAMFIIGCAGSIMYTGICILISSWSKSSFGCIIVGVVIIAAPILIFIFGNPSKSVILKFFPTMMPMFTYLFSNFKTELFGLEVLPFILFICFCILISVASAIAAKKLFIKPLK